MKAYSYPDGFLYFCLCDRGVRDAAKGNPFGVFKPLTEKDMKAIYLSAF